MIKSFSLDFYLACMFSYKHLLAIKWNTITIINVLLRTICERGILVHQAGLTKNHMHIRSRKKNHMYTRGILKKSLLKTLGWSNHNPTAWCFQIYFTPKKILSNTFYPSWCLWDLSLLNTEGSSMFLLYNSSSYSSKSISNFPTSKILSSDTQSISSLHRFVRFQYYKQMVDKVILWLSSYYLNCFANIFLENLIPLVRDYLEIKVGFT